MYKVKSAPIDNGRTSASWDTISLEWSASWAEGNKGKEGRLSTRERRVKEVGDRQREAEGALLPQVWKGVYQLDQDRQRTPLTWGHLQGSAKC